MKKSINISMVLSRSAWHATLLLLAISFLCPVVIVAQQETEIRMDGIQFPRLDSNAVGAPVLGLVFYDTISSELIYYDGNQWKAVGGAFELHDTIIRQKGGYQNRDFIFGREKLPANGEAVNGNFFFFDEDKAAFRGGDLQSSTFWSPDSIGQNSIAYGSNALATGDNSVSFGSGTVASGFSSVAVGFTSMAQGDLGSVALGNGVSASGLSGATAMGVGTAATGDQAATALGYYTSASGNNGAMALGMSTIASGSNGATAMGYGTEASGSYGATALGYTTEARGVSGATAMGSFTDASGGSGATAMGYLTEAKGDNGAIAMGLGTIATGNSCTALGLYNDTLVSTGTVMSSTSPIFIIGNGDFGAGNASNAMVVRKDGNVGIGNTNPSVKFKVGNAGDGSVARANAWDLFSDRRFKKDISYLENSLQKVLQLKGRQFTWKDSQKSDIGFIAQEVEAIISTVVTTAPDGYKSMDYGKLVPVLVEAIKELNAKITHQDSVINQFMQHHD